MSLESQFSKNRWFKSSAIAILSLLITVGVFAANDWFPKTDALTGEKTSWFGKKLPKNATSSAWSPLPPTTPTPQLSKEYIYAGQKLLAVEDANAPSAPPADIAVWRESNGNWMVQGQTGSSATTVQWGMAADIPVPGDFDGDGKTDFCIFRPSTGAWWLIYSSNNTQHTFNWGQLNDIPFAADFDGDGRSDAGVTRRNPTSGYLEWYPVYSANWSADFFTWGAHTDLPGPGDFNGDGRADAGVYRPSNQGYYWLDLVTSATNGVFVTPFSPATPCSSGSCKVVTSDYDGDGKSDMAIYNSSNAEWTIHRSTDGNLSTVTWGSAGNIPVHNDYDGDGKTDVAVWNNASSATWTIKRSSNGTTRTETFGTTGDIPVPAWYRR